VSKVWEPARLSTICERLRDAGQRRAGSGAKRGEKALGKKLTIWWHFEASRDSSAPFCQASLDVPGDYTQAMDAVFKPRSFNIGDPMPEDLQSARAQLLGDFPEHGWKFQPCEAHAALFPEAIESDVG
jgi:hypothetical protein